MGSLMEFAALQLERDSYSSRIDLSHTEEDGTAHRPPILHLSKSVRDTMVDGTLKTPLLVMGIEGGGDDVLKLLVNIDAWDEIGCLVLPEQSLRGTTLEPAMRKGVCSIWKSKTPSNGIVLVHASQKVPAQRANAWASTLLSTISAQRVVILDTIKPFDLGLSYDEVPCPLLRVLHANVERGDILGTALDKIPALETGSVVQGCAAAALTRSMLKKLRAALLLIVIPDTARTTAELAAAVHGRISAIVTQTGAVSADGVPLLHASVARPRQMETVKTIGGANPLYL